LNSYKQIKAPHTQCLGGKKNLQQNFWTWMHRVYAHWLVTI